MVIELVAAFVGVALLVVAQRVYAQSAQRRRTTKYLTQTIRSAPMAVPPRRYDPATSNVYADQRVLTPTRY